jgi:hypothetical protein
MEVTQLQRGRSRSLAPREQVGGTDEFRQGAGSVTVARREARLGAGRCGRHLPQRQVQEAVESPKPFVGRCLHFAVAALPVSDIFLEVHDHFHVDRSCFSFGSGDRLPPPSRRQQVRIGLQSVSSARNATACCRRQLQAD